MIPKITKRMLEGRDRRDIDVDIDIIDESRVLSAPNLAVVACAYEIRHEQVWAWLVEMSSNGCSCSAAAPSLLFAYFLRPLWEKILDNQILVIENF